MEKALQDVRACLAEDLPVFLVGPLGAGKTACAKKVAEEVLRRGTGSDLEVEGLYDTAVRIFGRYGERSEGVGEGDGRVEAEYLQHQDASGEKEWQFLADSRGDSAKSVLRREAAKDSPNRSMDPISGSSEEVITAEPLRSIRALMSSRRGLILIVDDYVGVREELGQDLESYAGVHSRVALIFVSRARPVRGLAEPERRVLRKCVSVPIELPDDKTAVALVQEFLSAGGRTMLASTQPPVSLASRSWLEKEAREIAKWSGRYCGIMHAISSAGASIERRNEEDIGRWLRVVCEKESVREFLGLLEAHLLPNERCALHLVAIAENTAIPLKRVLCKWREQVSAAAYEGSEDGLAALAGRLLLCEKDSGERDSEEIRIRSGALQAFLLKHSVELRSLARKLGFRLVRKNSLDLRVLTIAWVLGMLVLAASSWLGGAKYWGFAIPVLFTGVIFGMWWRNRER